MQGFRATRFEFRHRFWVIGAVFGVGFFLYRFDHENLVEALLGGAPARGAAQAAFGVAALVAAAGAALRTWASAYLDSEVVHDSELRTHRVVADGPYRHLRNPLYLGLGLIAIGIGALASRLGFAVILAGITVVALRLIGREEADLAASQGSAYEAYRAAVPRIVPTLRPRVPASGARARWGQALVGEGFTWGFAAALAAFAVSLDQRRYFWILGASMAIYAVSLAVQRRRRRRLR